MWGDHQQLQITSYRYQVNVNVLTIDSKGNGTVLKMPCTPNPALQDFAELPEGANVKDMWLLYTNENHYDALITEEDPIITLGTIEEIENNTIKLAESKIEFNNEKESHQCKICKFQFLNKIMLNEHMEKKHLAGRDNNPQNKYDNLNSGEGVMTEGEDEMDTKIVPTIHKHKIIKNLNKALKISQINLKTFHENITKLEVLYRGSEDEVKRLEEEKDRLKIEVKDLKEYTATDSTSKGTEQEKKQKVCKFQWNTFPLKFA